MSISIFDIYTIGIGPSSSHTVGPMKAAKHFIDQIVKSNEFEKIKCVKCDLYGSLALTGKGHGTDKAIILGLMGFDPESINSELIDNYLNEVDKTKKLNMHFKETVLSLTFSKRDDIKFQRRVSLPYHPNGMAFAAFDEKGQEIFREIYYSIGGGFILTEEDAKKDKITELHMTKVKYPFNNAAELIDMCKKNNLSIPDLIRENELSWRTLEEIENGVYKLWEVMEKCVHKGLRTEGILPGGLEVKRRAPTIYKNLISHPEKNLSDVLSIMDWVNLYALAVNEENAAGGQVITAPTNGAAGIIPAVLHYYVRFSPHANRKGIIDFLLTAAAIAILYKKKCLHFWCRSWMSG